MSMPAPGTPKAQVEPATAHPESLRAGQPRRGLQSDGQLQTLTPTVAVYLRLRPVTEHAVASSLNGLRARGQAYCRDHLAVPMIGYGWREARGERDVAGPSTCRSAP